MFMGLQYSAIFHNYATTFFPKDGSIRKRAVTPKVTRVHSIIQTKKS